MQQLHPPIEDIGVVDTRGPAERLLGLCAELLKLPEVSRPLLG
jgi:hypothetical protein